MTTTPQTAGASASATIRTAASARLAPLGFAALLGVLVLGVTGFAPVEALHNAAHDYRHSLGFPCH